MGVNIDAHVHDIEILLEDIESQRTKGDLPARDFLEKVYKTYGSIYGDKFISLCNEYYDEYNPVYKFYTLVEKYFGIEDYYAKQYDVIRGGADDYELYEELGLNPDEEDDNY